MNTNPLAGIGDAPAFVPTPAWGPTEFLLALILAVIVVALFFTLDALEQIKRAIHGEKPL